MKKYGSLGASSDVNYSARKGSYFWKNIKIANFDKLHSYGIHYYFYNGLLSSLFLYRQRII